MNFMSLRFAAFWCVLLLLLALSRVHFRVVTTNVAYHLGKLKGEEGALLEKRALLQSELAKQTNKKHLENLTEIKISTNVKSLPSEKVGAN